MFAPVTLYTQPGCRPCHLIMQKLDDAGINYDAVDVTKNNEAYYYVTKVLNAMSVPVIVTDTHEPIVGYQPDKLDELISYLTASETGV